MESAKIDTPKSKKKTLEERVNEYEKGLLAIGTVLGKKDFFVKNVIDFQEMIRFVKVKSINTLT